MTLFRLASTCGVACLALATMVHGYGAGFTGKKVVDGYYPSYSVSPENVLYSNYTHLNYFVFTTTPDASAISQAGIDDSTITDFVARAHAAGITVSYTVGGYTGSQYFSSNVATAANRTVFAQTLVSVMQEYDFDGIDIDWEYPGTQGEGDNIVSPNDAGNFLLFLQTLRNVAGVDARLSMAASVGGIYGPDGTILTDMSAWATVLDYVTVMTYDITGTWSGFTGPNAPLYGTCEPASNPYNIQSGVNIYIQAGFQPNHVLFGFPGYSYSYYVTPPLKSTTCSDGSTSTLYQYPAGTNCGNWVGSGSQYLYSDLVSNGWFEPQSGFRRIRDSTSQTVVLYNPQTQLFIPTEDPISAWAKARYAFQRRLAGVNVFDVSGDTPDGALVTQLRNGLYLNGATSIPTSRLAKRHLEEKARRAKLASH
ncbi:hypothetical protein JCM1841_006589 [Sporobolomyces salmonicolor]